MDILTVLDQVVSLLQQRGRVTYGVLKRQFALDDETLADLKEELLFSYPEVREHEGRGLLWTEAPGPSPELNDRASQPPIAYTPAHLVERIRAVTVNAGERKTITALFADLKGSTALIEGLDPEEAQAIIDPALQLMMDAVHQYEGFVAQPLGDGVFALFGAPLAHEDHPQRALYAALRMQEEMKRYAETLRQKGYPPLLMRVGLNTGEVVLRSIRKDDLHADYVPVGHSTNLAARMEQLAMPGSIVVSAYTQRLADGYFAFKDLGATQIKGVEEPLHIYELLGVGSLRTRLQLSVRRGLTHFVGRRGEMAQLQQALAEAQAGRGQVVGVMGEPGLGKSRLFYEFKLLLLRGCVVLEAFAVSYGKSMAYLPVIELLKEYFDIQAQDDERKRREKVTGKVLTLDRSLEDTLPYLFALLGIEEQPSPLQQMDPQIRRQRTFDALKKLLLRESLNQPLVLVFEDLHWIDAETQGLLDTLSESVANAKILVLTNYRPEYRHEWGQKTYYTQVRLAPLGKDEAEELLTFLLGNDASLTPLKQLILDKTQCTPFFMEEVVQTLAEEGALSGERRAYRLTRPTTTLQLPPTVQGLLAARIDRLAPDEKALLQQLAVIGRQFPLSLIRQVIAQPEADLYRLLASLQRKEFLYEQPAFPESEYIFKHALTQDVAYNSMLIERRKALHEQTGQALEFLYRDKLEEHFHEMAHHYSHSAHTEKAIEYLQKAGRQAVQRAAMQEAVVQFTAALALVRARPESPESHQQELSLCLALGTPLVLTKGHAAPEVEAIYTRARALCQQGEDSSQLFSVLLGLRRFYGVRGEFPTAFELSGQLLALAERLQNNEWQIRAHVMQAELYMLVGELSQGRTLGEQGLALYDPRHYRSAILQFGNDSRVGNLLQIAWVCWFLGSVDFSEVKLKEALVLVRENAHPFDTTRAFSHACFIAYFRREARSVRERAGRVVALASEHGFTLFSGWGPIFLGWTLAQEGRGEEGIRQILQGLATLQTMGARIFRPFLLFVLAETYGKTGQVEEGLEVLAEALEIVRETGECWWESEIYRLKGELLLAQAAQAGQTGT
jgi:class 3 adenylate cyclase/predicted ATPase